MFNICLDDSRALEHQGISRFINNKMGGLKQQKII